MILVSDALTSSDIQTSTAVAVSIIIPTYREAENIPDLLKQIDRVRQQHALDLELLIMDDDSRDGTEQIITESGYSWVRLHLRKTDRGLSQAVLDGLRLAKGQVCVVMDADLSHPPDRIPALLAEVNDGADFVIGSRYIGGGSTDATWGVFRWVNSKVATILARPFTRLKDPMAGFMAFPRSILNDGAPLTPVGYKIGLELLVKCRCQDVREIPIHFTERTHGHSKLTVKEQLKYLQHLRRLAVYRYPNTACLIQFLAVGGSGVLVNLAALSVLLAIDTPVRVAIALAIAGSIVSNFLMNRRFTFSYARRESAIKQFVGFVGACFLGAMVNYSVALAVLDHVTNVPQVAALLGIAAGTGINFLTNRLFVFKRTIP